MKRQLRVASGPPRAARTPLTLTAAVAATLIAAGLAPSATAQPVHAAASTVQAAPAAAAAAAAFTPLSPTRVADTRPGSTTTDGLFQGTGRIPAGGSLTLKVAGRAGVPATGVSAVSLNVTGVSASADTFLIAYPSGVARPNTSNLNLSAGQTYPNAVVTKVGSDGNIVIYNSAGTVDVVVDVNGYFLAAGGVNAINPARLLDTRAGQATIDGQNAGSGAVGPDGQVTFKVLGRGGVPTTGVSAVFLDVVMVQPTLTPSSRPSPPGRCPSSTVNGKANSTVPNLTMMKVGANGAVTIANKFGSAHMVVDVVGYIPTGGNVTAINPQRAYDSRTIPARVNQQDSRRVQITGVAGVPAGAAAAIVNVTGTGATKDTFVTTYPAGQALPVASTLNMRAGDTRANMAVVKLDSTGAMSAFNAWGSQDIIVDVLGYVAGTTTPNDTASIAITADTGLAPATGGAVLSSIGWSDARWVAHLGDMAYQSGTGIEQQWCNFAKARINQPLQLIAGNHEAQNGDGSFAKFAACLPDRLGATGDYSTSQWFYDDGPVRYIGISPNIQLPGAYRSYGNGTAEQAWLAARIDEAKAAGKWTIVGMHIPCLTIGLHQCEADPALTNMLLSKKVDVIVSGHNHDYERTHQVTGSVSAASVVDSDNRYKAGAGTVQVVVGNGGYGPRALTSSRSQASGPLGSTARPRGT